jgi:hypothetical protein
MRIYDGSPRQDFEEVLRSIGVSLDRRGVKDVLVLEIPDGFIIQAVVHSGSPSSAWSESFGQEEKETMTFTDDEIAKAMDEAIARRGHEAEADLPGAGTYEHALRIIGRYIDEQHPKDIFFFEQEGAFVVRLHHTTQTGSRHTLAEFTRDDIAALVAEGPGLRKPTREAGPQGADRA